MSQKKIIGRREIVDILDLELYGLDAKIDTGADSNSLHCDDIFIDNENKIVTFKLLDEVHPAYHGKKNSNAPLQIKKSKKFKWNSSIKSDNSSNSLFFWKKI